MKKHSKLIDRIEAKRLPDNDPDASYLEQEGFEDRLAAYRRGAFYYVGVRVEATIIIDGVYQNISSGGLWGIEDDSTEDYLAEVIEEEMHQLRDQLLALGFSAKAIAEKAVS